MHEERLTPLPEVAGARLDFASRLSARSVIGGVVVTLAVFGVLMTLGGGLGLWSLGRLEATEGPRLGAGLAVWAVVSWVLSALLGGFVAALSARSPLRRDGLLQGLVTWAGACLLGGILACVWFMSAISSGLLSPWLVEGLRGPGVMWAFFIADALAVVAALFGGLLGARLEARRFEPEATTLRPRRGAPLVPSPQPG
jgi:hypothetical protein